MVRCGQCGCPHAQQQRLTFPLPLLLQAMQRKKAVLDFSGFAFSDDQRVGRDALHLKSGQLAVIACLPACLPVTSPTGSCLCMHRRPAMPLLWHAARLLLDSRLCSVLLRSLHHTTHCVHSHAAAGQGD